MHKCNIYVVGIDTPNGETTDILVEANSPKEAENKALKKSKGKSKVAYSYYNIDNK